MLYDKYLAPPVAWYPCQFCRFPNENIEDLASPAQNFWVSNMQNPISTQKIALDEQIIHPSIFSFSYPIVEIFENTDVQSIINNAIINEVDNLLRIQVLLPEKIDFKEIGGFYKIPLNENRLLSILFGLYTYTGGAHGNTIYSSLTINLENGQIYKLSDLFNPNVYFTAILNEIILKEIQDKKIPLISEFKGIEYDQQFYFTPNALVLYYQVYEYTPYSYGLFEISIPYADIKNLLYPLSPIEKLL